LGVQRLLVGLVLGTQLFAQSAAVKLATNQPTSSRPNSVLLPSHTSGSTSQNND